MSENQLNASAFGESIRRGRKQKGMTQEALAQVLNVSAQAVSKWETGQSLPDIGLLLPLSKALGVGVNELLG
ncbi:MAG: helix-turn-helix transcriptional regulator, partial [Clostridia bacterium]|nr:helix-turn-helix transcriptional regulator [Clostridia bacterium]